MNDRELLELAARAAGYQFSYSYHSLSIPVILAETGRWRQWDPLTDDGDALRLAVQLDITIGPEHPDVVGKSLCRASWNNRNMSLGEFGDGDKPSAYRRAIVRAAAEIGKSMGGEE
ncbi:TPA: hypothetical protein ACXJFQ_005113 [Pseudomonas aeruginosa]